MSTFQTDFKKYLEQNVNDTEINNLNCEYHTTDEFNNKYCNINSNNIRLSVIHVNIRSLNANHSKLRQLLAELKIRFFVIVLSEIWNINIEFLHNILDGYVFVYDLPVSGSVGAWACLLTTA